MDLSLHGWDIAYAIRLPELNARLHDMVMPVRIETRAGGRSVAFTMGGWSFVPGGAGKLLRASVLLTDGELGTAVDDGQAPPERFSAKAHLTIELDAISHDIGGGQPGVLLTMARPRADDIVFVRSVRIQEGRPEIEGDLLGSLRQWFDDHPDTIGQVIGTVYLANQANSDIEKWLRPTSISYAYADAPDPADCVLAILGMTGERSFDNLDQQISQNLVPKGVASAILLSPRLFLDTIIRKALPTSFPGTAVEDYDVSEAERRIRLKAPKVLDMEVEPEGTDGKFHPLLTHMEISIGDNLLVSQAHCQISREGVFTAYAEHTCAHRLVLDRNTRDGPAITFMPAGNPFSKNRIEVTPEHKHRGELMSYGLYGLGAALTLATGGVGGVVIGLVSSALGQLAEKAGDIVEYQNKIRAPDLDLLGLHLATPCLWAGDTILNASDVELNDGLRLSGDLRHL